MCVIGNNGSCSTTVESLFARDRVSCAFWILVVSCLPRNVSAKHFRLHPVQDDQYSVSVPNVSWEPERRYPYAYLVEKHTGK